MDVTDTDRLMAVREKLDEAMRILGFICYNQSSDDKIEKSSKEVKYIDPVSCALDSCSS